MSSEMVRTPALSALESARLPTAFGEFTVTVYRDGEQREHLAVRMGDLDGPPVLVRIHSECLTGDVFGSVRCDCGEQLQAALRHISQEGRGLLLYLRQEGRGIGLDNKIRAYALQDRGMDTVEANLHLGFPADGRSYSDAAAILKHQGVHAVRLVTNNPAKVQALESRGIVVVERVGYEIQPRPENYSYLRTKAKKMGHLLHPLPRVHGERAQQLANRSVQAKFWGYDSPQNGLNLVSQLRDRLREAELGQRQRAHPWVTLSYAQSLDGSIAAEPGKPLQLSNPQSQTLTHELRSLHDAVLVGINTVLTDNPRLTVRLVKGKNPQPVVLDSSLRFPVTSKLFRPPCIPPIIATAMKASALREKRLREAGAHVIRLRSRRKGLLDLRALLDHLKELGVRSIMVEGGGRVITEFLSCRLVDQVVVTIAPLVVGGVSAVTPLGFGSRHRSEGSGRLLNVQYHSFGGDLVVYADVEKAPGHHRPAKPPQNLTVVVSPEKATIKEDAARAPFELSANRHVAGMSRVPRRQPTE
jgi:GTP cyclohydrolase II